MTKQILLNIEGLPKLKIWEIETDNTDDRLCSSNCKHICDDENSIALSYCNLFGLQLKSQIERCTECILVFDNNNEIKK